MSEVLRQASIHPQSFYLDRQEFFDQLVNQLTSDGQRYSRTPLGARGNTTCSMAQSCQVNWQTTISGEIMILKLNKVHGLEELNSKVEARSTENFSGNEDPKAN
ncbi:MAG: hypothetical protein EZS28_008229 [Streblomastix strix]|uniref:Uncharacterized protein n=1 Tax=Streblomastix strix TaxID=222440 RepID=A0A5J4WP90_9EUKA|nr:MAG: hypothetical protein EZS28_008229 [Streblomastix strix]